MDANYHVPGYKFTQHLYAGSRTLVYRGIQQSDASPIVIKLLRDLCHSFNELMQFRNQYAIAQKMALLNRNMIYCGTGPSPNLR